MTVTDQQEAPPTRRAWASLWVLAAALAMVVLDGTIVGVALPTIITELKLSLTSAQWVNSLYAMVFAALLLTFGRLGDRWGRRRLLLAGVALFVAGSLLAALASEVSILIAARAVQGVGGALILPSTLSTVNATFRGRSRAAAFGIWGAVMSGAAALGPLLGGWLTSTASWQWIFLVNVPIGIAVIAAALVWVPETTGAPDATGVDLLGPILSAVGFALLVFGLIEGTMLGWWAPKIPFDIGGWTWPLDAPLSPVPVALALGSLCLAAFVAHQVARARSGAAHVLDVELFRIPTFAFGNATAGLVAVGEFALVFVLPLYLVTSLGMEALGAGVVLAAMAGGAFLAGAAARHLAAAMGAARVVVLGLGLELVGAVATALVIAGGLGPWWVAAALVPYGVGLGLASAQLTSTVLRDVPVAHSGAGSAVQSTVRQVGSAVGSAVGGTALALALGDHQLGRVTAGEFASAAAVASWVAAAVIALGLGSALLVARAARTS